MDTHGASPMWYPSLQRTSLLDGQRTEKILEINDVTIMNCSSAKQIPIPLLLEKQGILPVTRNASGTWYHSPWSPSGDRRPSLQVSPDGRMFKDWSSGVQGNIIDLAMAVQGTSSVSRALDFMDKLVGNMGTFLTSPALERDATNGRHKKSQIEIVETTSIHSPALLDYLSRRNIPVTVAMQYCSEVKYRMAGQKRAAPFFAVGFRNDSGGYELRNAFAKLANSPKDITTLGDTKCGHALVFEGCFDFLSAVVLGIFLPNESFAVVLNSTSLVQRAIERLAGATSVKCYLDNDDAGKRATDFITNSLPTGIAINSSSIYQPNKDLNEYLIGSRTVIR